MRFCFSSSARGWLASTLGMTGCCGCSFHQAVLHASVQNRFCLGPLCCLMTSNGALQVMQRGAEATAEEAEFTAEVCVFEGEIEVVLSGEGEGGVVEAFLIFFV